MNHLNHYFRAVIEVRCQIYIERRPEEVFAFISNVVNNPLWQSGMKSCRMISSGPMAKGSRYEQEASFLGKEIKSKFEITQFEPHRLIKGESISSSFPISFTRTVKPKDRGSQVETRVEGDPRGFFRIAQPLMKWMVKHAIEKDYKELKILLENKRKYHRIMRKQIAAGNWKMNKTVEQGKDLVTALLQVNIPKGVEVILGVPYVLLPTVRELTQSSAIKVAAQNCHQKESGAYTGEISAPMLSALGIEHVILGHSERREYFHESNQLLAEKVDIALKYGLGPIFCCGESLDIREAGNHISHVKTQLEEGLFQLDADSLLKVIIAYEPIWAIGTGVTASPAQAQGMHAEIRALIKEKYGEEVADQIPILYGGSVKPDNATELFGQPDVDGGLVGGASLKADAFTAIIQA